MYCINLHNIAIIFFYFTIYLELFFAENDIS
jgi:hypothetical protein